MTDGFFFATMANTPMICGFGCSWFALMGFSQNVVKIFQSKQKKILPVLPWHVRYHTLKALISHGYSCIHVKLHAAGIRPTFIDVSCFCPPNCFSFLCKESVVLSSFLLKLPKVINACAYACIHIAICKVRDREIYICVCRQIR